MEDNKTETKPDTNLSDKELNFRLQQAHYEKKLAEKDERLSNLEKRIEELSHKESEEEYEPYVDEKKLNRKLEKFSKDNQQMTQSQIRAMLKEERDEMWRQNHPDFEEVMKRENLQKLANHDPELAQTILQMPDNFDRQKLVYKNITALNLHKPKEPEPNIQDIVNKNRRGMFYQPSGLANSPYQSQGDFSPKGQQDAYNKMQELKQRLRLG